MINLRPEEGVLHTGDSRLMTSARVLLREGFGVAVHTCCGPVDHRRGQPRRDSIVKSPSRDTACACPIPASVRNDDRRAIASPAVASVDANAALVSSRHRPHVRPGDVAFDLRRIDGLLAAGPNAISSACVTRCLAREIYQRVVTDYRALQAPDPVDAQMIVLTYPAASIPRPPCFTAAHSPTVWTQQCAQDAGGGHCRTAEMYAGVSRGRRREVPRRPIDGA